MSEEKTGGTVAWFTALDDDGRAHVASKGWDKLEGPTAAAEIAKAYRGLEKLHGGVASGDYIKLPKPDNAEEQQAFWTKVGKPADVTGYRFDDVRFTDGSSFDDGMADALRGAALAADMPAHMLDKFVKAMIPHMENEEKAALAADQVDAAAHQRALTEKWGAQEANNKFIAARAMDTLGITKEAQDALTKGIGYVPAMEHFLKLGQMLGEHRFVSGSAQGGSALDPASAQAQLTALSSDSGWVKRFVAGDVTARKQRDDLLQIIHGSK